MSGAFGYRCGLHGFALIKLGAFDAFGTGMNTRKHSLNGNGHHVQIGLKRTECSLGALLPLASRHAGMVRMLPAGIGFFGTDVTGKGHIFKSKVKS